MHFLFTSSTPITMATTDLIVCIFFPLLEYFDILECYIYRITQYAVSSGHLFRAPGGAVYAFPSMKAFIIQMFPSKNSWDGRMDGVICDSSRQERAAWRQFSTVVAFGFQFIAPHTHFPLPYSSFKQNKNTSLGLFLCHEVQDEIVKSEKRVQ